MATVTIQKYTGKRSTSYAVKYRDPVTGKWKHYATYRKKREADQSRNDLRSLIDTGQVPKSKKCKMLTFSEAAEILDGNWQQKLAKNELSSETVEGYRMYVGILNREFAKRLLCDIFQSEIKFYHQALFEAHSPAYANRNLFIIKQVFKTGMVEGALFEDPSEKVAYLSEKQHERNKFIFPEQIIELIEASQKLRAKYYMPSLIYLGAEHGASRQEALSLRWKDVNFDFDGVGLIRLFRNKNKKERTEFLMPRTRQALLEWKHHQKWMRHRHKVEFKDKYKDVTLVFCHLDGRPRKRFDKAWRRICDLVGLEDFHYHDLRHTFSSNLLLSGSNLKDVKEMIGHADISMTDRYSHLADSHKRRLQEKLAKHYVGYK